MQIVVNAINEGSVLTVRPSTGRNPLQIRQGVDGDLGPTDPGMKEGKAGTLMISRANPAYSHPLADQFKAALKMKSEYLFSERLDGDH
jgi:hypothetical protein